MISSRSTLKTEHPFMGKIRKFYSSLVEGRQNTKEEQKYPLLLSTGDYQKQMSEYPYFLPEII